MPLAGYPGYWVYDEPYGTRYVGPQGVIEDFNDPVSIATEPCRTAPPPLRWQIRWNAVPHVQRRAVSCLFPAIPTIFCCHANTDCARNRSDPGQFEHNTGRTVCEERLQVGPDPPHVLRHCEIKCKRPNPWNTLDIGYICLPLFRQCPIRTLAFTANDTFPPSKPFCLTHNHFMSLMHLGASVITSWVSAHQ
eukprot:3935036-Rhodomonas_salina.1